MYALRGSTSVVEPPMRVHEDFTGAQGMCIRVRPVESCSRPAQARILAVLMA